MLKAVQELHVKGDKTLNNLKQNHFRVARNHIVKIINFTNALDIIHEPVSLQP